MRRDNETRIQTALRLLFVRIINCPKRIDVSDIEIIFTMLDLRL